MPDTRGSKLEIAFPSDDSDDEVDYSWRGTPDHNLSDWTVQVTSSDGDEQTSYHVHRLILSTGSRSCGYFRAVFQGDYAEADTKCSKISLHPRTLQEFPNFLDWVYNLPSFNISSENALILMKLAEYFSCSSLSVFAMDFVVDEVRPLRPWPFGPQYDIDKAMSYLLQAHELGNSHVVQSLSPLICFNLESVIQVVFGEVQAVETRAASKIKFCLPVELFDVILSWPHLECNFHDKEFIMKGERQCYRLDLVSEFVCRYFSEHNPESFTFERFLRSTREEIMPYMTEDAAKYFLSMMHNVSPSQQDDWEALTKLAVRCYDAIPLEPTSYDEQAQQLVQDFCKSHSCSKIAHMLSVAKLASQLRQSHRKEKQKTGEDDDSAFPSDDDASAEEGEQKTEEEDDLDDDDSTFPSDDDASAEEEELSADEDFWEDFQQDVL